MERDNKIKDNTIVFNGLTYGLVLSPDTGRVWLDRNLGASQVCTSVTDTACYGDLYQWGRAKDGHESRDSGITKTLASSITPATTTLIISQRVPGDWVSGSGTGADISGALRAAAWVDGGVNDICPAGFSVPTEEELITLATTAKVKDTATAFSSFLKLPLLVRVLLMAADFWVLVLAPLCGVGPLEGHLVVFCPFTQTKEIRLFRVLVVLTALVFVALRISHFVFVI
ncbi:hypothetical protein BSPWISOXPB_5281 [uncultured Gammaproteobacteria bacterium]|nr:hypothetical protein BSPWISOXPB_5281 [uncultured Gammaproteobacteria bacterium]